MNPPPLRTSSSTVAAWLGLGDGAAEGATDGAAELDGKAKLDGEAELDGADEGAEGEAVDA
jgi:hypothetical protein